MSESLEKAFGKPYDEVQQEWLAWIDKSEEDKNINFLAESAIFF